jgi:hypothetical protein
MVTDSMDEHRVRDEGMLAGRAIGKEASVLQSHGTSHAAAVRKIKRTAAQCKLPRSI